MRELLISVVTYSAVHVVKKFLNVKSTSIINIVIQDVMNLIVIC